MNASELEILSAAVSALLDTLILWIVIAVVIALAWSGLLVAAWRKLFLACEAAFEPDDDELEAGE